MAHRKGLIHLIIVLLLSLFSAVAFAKGEACKKLVPNLGTLERKDLSVRQSIVASLIQRFQAWAKPTRPSLPKTEPTPIALPEYNSATENLIGYIESLLTEQIINEGDLKIFKDSIVAGSPQNLITEDRAVVSTVHQLHAKFFEEFLVDPEILWATLPIWIEQRFVGKSIENSQKASAEIESKGIFNKIKFNPIIPEDYEFEFRNNQGEPVTVPMSLTHPIEVMEAKVTQAQWLEVFGELPKALKFIAEKQVLETFINGEYIKFDPDQSVDSITWWSALVFANELSRRHGLKPAYDFRFVKMQEGTSAAAGDLHPVTYQSSGTAKILIDVRVNARNIYETEGYRLPTVAEQGFLLKSMGRKPMRRKEIDNIGQGLVTIQGQEFINLFEYFEEYTADYLGWFMEGGVNPVYSFKGTSHRFALGTTQIEGVHHVNRLFNELWQGAMADSGTGFRLVRSIPVTKRQK